MSTGPPVPGKEEKEKKRPMSHRKEYAGRGPEKRGGGAFRRPKFFPFPPLARHHFGRPTEGQTAERSRGLHGRADPPFRRALVFGIPGEGTGSMRAAKLVRGEREWAGSCIKGRRTMPKKNRHDNHRDDGESRPCKRLCLATGFPLGPAQPTCIPLPVVLGPPGATAPPAPLVVQTSTM
jgi:hypothetical protein